MRKMRKLFEWFWATYQTMSLVQWLVALPVWGAGASAMPIIGIIKSWPIWLLALVSAVVAFLWLTVLTWIMSNFNSMKKRGDKQETKQKDITPSNNAIANNNSMAINAPNAGQVIQAGHDIVMHAPATVSPKVDERIFVDVTPDFLISFFHEKWTTIQSEEAVKGFIGKWMRVEGDLGDVENWGNIWAFVTFKNSVFTGEDSHYKHLSMVFNGKYWLDLLYGLQKGTRIIVEGKIGKVESLGIRLDDCEFKKK